MEFYIAVFSSRAEALHFADFLTINRIYSKVIPTPKEAGRTCGLSVKVGSNDFDNAKFLLLRAQNSSFLGWLFLNKNNEIVFVRD